MSGTTTTLEQTGYLVRLHPDSARALKELKPDQAKDAAGFVYGTLRGGDGKYAHVVKLKQVANLQTISSGAAILSALAMQAQLDRIERSLVTLQTSVDAIDHKLDDAADAKRDALILAYGEAYRIAHKTGELTSAVWQNLPPVSDAYALRQETFRAIRRTRAELESLPAKAKERKASLDRLENRLKRLLVNLDRDDRMVGQAQALRLWHMACSDDRALPATLEETREQVTTRMMERDEVLREIEAALVDADVHSLMQKPRLRTRRTIRAQSHEISWAVRQRRVEVAKALPRQLSAGAGDSSPISTPQTPEQLAQEYTLGTAEAIILTAMQTWMMRQDLGSSGTSESKAHDLHAFIAASQAAMSEYLDVEPDIAALAMRLVDSCEPDSETMATDRELLRSLGQRPDTRVRSLLILIELASFHPWTPTDPERPVRTAVAWNERQREKSLATLADCLSGTDPSDVDEVLSTYQSVLSQLGRGGVNWWLVGALSVAGVGIGALTGGLAAPLIGAAVGSTVFGLSGAAATSAGLAALGGGSLAAGGLGMAGGTALIASVGGIAGGSLIGAGSAFAAPSDVRTRTALMARMAAETVRLQVLARVILIGELHDYDQLTLVIQGLKERQAEVRDRRAELGSPDPEESDSKEIAVDERTQLKALDRALKKGINELLQLKVVDSRATDRHP